jgi:peptide/nickel transport system substrate-binding protein
VARGAALAAAIAVSLNSSRYTVPTGTSTAIAPILLAACSSRRVASVEPTTSTSAPANRLSLRFWTIAGATFRVRTVELIRRQLRQVGIAVELNFAPPQTLFRQILRSGVFDAIELNFNSLLGEFGADLYGCGGASNFTGYCQRLVTHDLDQADRILDAEQRACVLNRADAQMAKDVPVIPLFQTPNVIAYRATLRGVVSASGNELWNAENWWFAE